MLVFEYGTTIDCRFVVVSYQQKLDIHYKLKENTGQGFSRNLGAEKANSEWLVFFDSDCVIPPGYFEHLAQLISDNDYSAYCGPDASRGDFSPLQRAISYSMTSFLTTGGIRGRKVKIDQEAHLRSYNLVIRKDVFQDLGGFAKTNMGEDMELSHRFRKAGFKAQISDSIFVYHKRRNTLSSFYRLVRSFGKSRIQLKRNFEIPIKLPHLFPSVFLMGLFFAVVGLALNHSILRFLMVPYLFYFVLIFLHASLSQKSIRIGLLSIITSLIQHIGYGWGFIRELVMPDK